ncbi:MAG: UDP-N-acetylmuramoyl-L-alanyl-D-glutamate--2,6-diaminopimelate ligase [Gammaproteobacteria bacterium]
MMAARKTPAPRIGLGELLGQRVRSAPERLVEVGGLCEDSRKVSPGDVFFARAGTRTDGRRYIGEAVSAGAVAVVVDAVGLGSGAVDVDTRRAQLIVVDDVGAAIGEAAHRFYGRPSEHLRVVGVTGTNGKTSVTHFVSQALDRVRASGGEPAASGVIGTLGFGPTDALGDASLTTPDAIGLHARLAELRERGLRDVAVEVSSHALDQQRAAGVRFVAAAFTNLTRDHLDYHADMDEYAASKARLFDWESLRHAVVNVDDEAGRKLAVRIAGRGHPPVLFGTALGERAQEHAADELGRAMRLLAGYIERADRAGLSLDVAVRLGSEDGARRARIEAPLLGPFNGSNLLTALGLLLALDVPLPDACRGLSAVRALPGRMEAFGGNASLPLVVVDYSHTPDALVNALAAISRYTGARLWCVFGCGGDRDAGKRPLMAQAAAGLADELVITDDNPRFEDADRIVANIVAGLPEGASYAVNRDRAAAIAHAVHAARPGDAVLVAGKGHEQYQEVAGTRHYFSDADVVRRALGASRSRAKGGS